MGENGFVTQPKESWLLEKGSKSNEDCHWNAIPGAVLDPNEKLEPALLTALNDDVILSTECFRKLADGAETLFVEFTDCPVACCCVAPSVCRLVEL